MSATIYASFDKFIAKYEKQDPPSTPHITSQRIANILSEIIADQFPESSSFTSQYFRQILLQVAQAIMNVVYRKQQVFASIDQLVAYTNIIQFILHSNAIQLPEIIRTRLEKYVYSLIYSQNCAKIKIIYNDSLNSVTISSFYKQVYMSAFEFRYRELLKHFGIMERTSFLALILLREVIEKNEFDVENYEGSITAEWIIISLVYFILTSKYQSMRQIPVLSKILEKYHSLNVPEYAFRKIDGLQLCHFYNNFVIDRIKRTESYEVDKMIDETTVEHSLVSNLVVSPINNENNTVLDNIAFSSSYEH